jgi:uncharacterized membrane protein YhaH (DUF805 family)
MSKMNSKLRWFFDSEGRLTKKEFWPPYLMAILPPTLIVVLLQALTTQGSPLLHIDTGYEGEDTGGLYNFWFFLLVLVHVATIPLMVRRYRDAGTKPRKIVTGFISLAIFWLFQNPSAAFNLFSVGVFLLALPGFVAMLLTFCIHLFFLLKESKNLVD